MDREDAEARARLVNIDQSGTRSGDGNRVGDRQVAGQVDCLGSAEQGAKNDGYRPWERRWPE